MIRKIEKEIDTHHKNHTLFKKGLNQAIIDMLRVFEDACRLSMLNPLLMFDQNAAESQMRMNMDGLNVAINWIYSLCPNEAADFSLEITKNTYMDAATLLKDFAVPYSEICSGYIGYSRKYFDAIVNDNIISFTITKDKERIFLSNASRLLIKKASYCLDFLSPSPGIICELKDQVFFENDRICYNTSPSVYDAFRRIANAHWDISHELPDDWKFDKFALNEFKEIWTIIDTMCMIHYQSCILSGRPGFAVEDNVIIQNKDSLIDFLTNTSGLSSSTVNLIIEYLIYDPKIKNNDIMYQPIVKLGEQVIITPHLFMGSNPERNLVSLVNKLNNDMNHSEETNKLEGIMLSQIKGKIKDTVTLIHCEHREINPDMPDVDLAYFDKSTNSLLLCELKWLTSADSTQEVFSRQEDIEHGCEQIRTLMTYAMCNREIFIKKLFDVNVDANDVDLFCCVISKNDILSKSLDIPVISQDVFVELMNQQHPNTVFHTIRNRDFLSEPPTALTPVVHPIEYAGYTFEIPALVSSI